MKQGTKKSRSGKDPERSRAVAVFFAIVFIERSP